MSNYINQVSDSLKNHISELANNPCLFLRNPNVDFSRKRKIDFKTFIGIMMNSGGATMSKELLDFFDFNKNTPSVSAFTQQRSKVLPEAFEYLFKSFTDDNLPTTNNYHGYRLIACDGSNLTIATNQKDPETFWERNQHGSIVNKLHLNVFYDVLNRIYTDVLVQTAADYNESRACATMIDRSKLENVILVADRGYENYNIFAHAIEKGWKFAIRVKDKNSNGIASGLNLPPNDEFDIDITQIFSRKNTKTTKNAGYKWMPVNQVFDYLPRKSDKTYELSFRIIRFPIGSNSYEIIITNLDRNIFDVKKIKEIYHLRWGIETSFRELKYAIGLTSFHARKPDFIKQEIYARLLLYNYCELITTHVIKQMKNNDKTKQVNFTIAIYICREYLRNKRNLSPPDVINLIEKHVLPVRPGRKDPRKVKPQASVSFLYRVA